MIGPGTRELHQALTVRGDVLADALEVGEDRARELGDERAGGERRGQLVDRGDLDLRDVSQLVTDAAGERAEGGAALGDQQRSARLFELRLDRAWPGSSSSARVRRSISASRSASS